jgi:DNA-binding response OmpR family regulator
VKNGVTLGEQSVFPSLDQQFYRDAHLFVHLHHRMGMLDGQAITLTNMQHRLLALLVEHAGEIVPRAIILTQLWGAQPTAHKHSLAFHMRALRKKLGTYHYIETVPRVGYRFRPSDLPGD